MRQVEKIVLQEQRQAEMAAAHRRAMVAAAANREAMEVKHVLAGLIKQARASFHERKPARAY